MIRYHIHTVVLCQEVAARTPLPSSPILLFVVHKDGNFHLRYRRQEREAARAQEKGGKNDVITVFKKKKKITFNVQRTFNSERRNQNGLDSSELTMR